MLRHLVNKLTSAGTSFTVFKSLELSTLRQQGPAACSTLDFPGSVKNDHSTNYLLQKVFSVLFPGSSSSPVIGAPKRPARLMQPRPKKPHLEVLGESPRVVAVRVLMMVTMVAVVRARRAMACMRSMKAGSRLL